MKNIKKTKGFSILELIIVLAAVAVLLTFGIEFILRFRSSVELQTSYSELITAVKSLQNASRNSLKIFNSNEKTDLYTIIPTIDKKSYRYAGCTFSGGGFTDAECLLAEIPLNTIKALPAEIVLDIEYIDENNLVSSGLCAFEKRTGKVWAVKENSGTYKVFSNGKCSYTVTSTKTLEKKAFSVSVGKSNIDI